MFRRKQKLKVLAENSDHLQDKLRRRDEKIKGLIDKNFKLTEKLKKTQMLIYALFALTRLVRH